MLRLFASWHNSLVPESTFRLVTLIAVYTGMRLGEICTLRKEDLWIVDGIPLFKKKTGYADTSYFLSFRPCITQRTDTLEPYRTQPWSCDHV